MPRKRDGGVSRGDLAGTLPGLKGRGRAMSAQTRHHFTTLRQVNQLVKAGEGEPELGFMARLLALCSLPRTNPKQRVQYIRRNGPYKLIMQAGGDPARLPFGNLPRLLLAWVCTEAVRTQHRELVLGRSLYEFMQRLGMEDRSGGLHGERTRLKNQMTRLFNCSVQLIYADTGHRVQVQSFIADRAEFWWDVKRPAAPVLWDSTIRLGERIIQRDHRTPDPVRPAHPQGAQTVVARSRSVLLARLPDVCAQAAAVPLVETALQPVRRGPGQIEREHHGATFPQGLYPRVEKN